MQKRETRFSKQLKNYAKSMQEGSDNHTRNQLLDRMGKALKRDERDKKLKRVGTAAGVAVLGMLLVAAYLFVDTTPHLTEDVYAYSILTDNTMRGKNTKASASDFRETPQVQAKVYDKQGKVLLQTQESPDYPGQESYYIEIHRKDASPSTRTMYFIEQ